MGRGTRRIAKVVGALLVGAFVASCSTLGPADVLRPVGVGSAGQRGEAPVTCGLPSAGQDFRAVAPETVGVDGAAVRAAIDELSSPLTRSLRIYRRGCLIGQTSGDVTGATEPAELFSMTKSVVSLGVGRAIELGRLRLDDPIGPFLPEVDEAHAVITVRELLTQTSGLRFGWVNDLLGSTEDSVSEAMSMPFAHPPGTFFEYAQTTVTTLALVVERAVGEDFQEFMSTELFAPIGIAPGSWRWARDGAGRTQGYAWLEMRPVDMARLGELALHRGEWGGRRLIGADYIEQMGAATPTNGGYGFLAQTNAGEWHIGTFGGVRKDRRVIPSAPVDTLIFSGFLEQATYVVPSLDLVIVRFGLPPDPQWKDRLFRTLLAGVPEAPHATGPLPPADPIEFDWQQIIDIGELIRRSASLADG